MLVIFIAFYFWQCQFFIQESVRDVWGTAAFIPLLVMQTRIPSVLSELHTRRLSGVFASQNKANAEIYFCDQDSVNANELHAVDLLSKY